MDEILDRPSVKGKVFSRSTIISAAFFGGPILAAYFLSENFKAIEKRDLVLQTWLWSIGLLILTITLTLTTERYGKFLYAVLPFIHIFLARFVYENLQEKEISLYLHKEGSKHQWWRGYLIIFMFLILIVFPLTLIYLSNNLTH